VAQTGENDDRPANKGDDIASGKTFEHLIQPVLNADHKPVEIPKLYIVPHGELFGLLDCLIVAGANKRLKAIEIAVASNCVSPVFNHLSDSLLSQSERNMGATIWTSQIAAKSNMPPTKSGTIGNASAFKSRRYGYPGCPLGGIETASALSSAGTVLCAEPPARHPFAVRGLGGGMAHWRSKVTQGVSRRPLFWTIVALTIISWSLVAGLWLI
jgi:hypothetical protein